MSCIVKIIILLLITAYNIFGQDKFLNDIDLIVANYSKQELFSGVILITKDGTPVFEKSYGYADWEIKKPLNTQTLFNIGSINKLFTRVLIMQLEKEGKLNTDDPISKYIDIFPDDREEKITIQHLLDMSSGLGDYLQNPAFRSYPGSYKNINDFMNIIKEEPLLFEPGSNKRYSNSGYVVLGAIIEKITGKIYSDYLNEIILHPYSMDNTYYLKYDEKLSNMASGTLLNYKGQKHNSTFEAAPSPAGGIFSNVYDLSKFDLAMRKNFQPNFLGIFAGGTPAWNAIINQYDKSYTLIILSNFGKAAELVEDGLISMMEGNPIEEIKVPVNMTFYNVLTKSCLSKLRSEFNIILKDYELEANERHLNNFGYELLDNNETELAIEVLKLNTELYPDSPRVYEALADAFMKSQDKENAILNYKKVLELEPENLKIIEKQNQLNK